jgi:hypothetical protein
LVALGDISERTGHEDRYQARLQYVDAAVMGAVTGRAPQDEFTDFVGRRSELAQIAAMLERGRLVTVVGPGGVGKTRLSLVAASQAAGNYPGPAAAAQHGRQRARPARAGQAIRA